MAVIFPTLENIQRLKVSPTSGEWFLLNYLIENLPEEVEIYFQPFINGDMPDIVLIQKDVGVTIIEVKDWSLDSYSVDNDNKWHLKYNGQHIKSPLQQVYHYKDTFFNLHINGLLDELLKDKGFYGKIKPLVYFHNQSQESLDTLYATPISYWKEQEQQYHDQFKTNQIKEQEYNQKLSSVKYYLSKLNRDVQEITFTAKSLYKIKLPRNSSVNFSDEIYTEFLRYLKPPYHTLEEGKEIKYLKKQDRLTISKPTKMKIKGVAGSGKTTVMAKRAVNAYKRSNSRVLIISYNHSLRNYIHDKISDIREGFGWENFYIDNYHSFFRTAVKNTSIESETLFSNFLVYDDIDLFEGYENEIAKYDTILIDEIQDWKIEWIKIIEKYFLKRNGELVLFGDEKQNIFQRTLDEETKILVPRGFGSWETLNTSMRFQGDGGRVLNLTKKFQQAFFLGKYEIDSNEKLPTQTFLNLGIFHTTKIKNNFQKIEPIVKHMYKHIKENKIHPDDVCIMSSRVNILRDMDYYIRTNLNEKTMTTFETREQYEEIEHKKLNKNIEKIEIEKIRKNKKRHFYFHSGLIKLSTIHSFKGADVQTIFLIVHPDDKEEMIYSAITRCKFNIMVYITTDSKFCEFFTKELAVEDEEIIKNQKKTHEKLNLFVTLKKIINFDYKNHGKIVEYENVKPYKILFMNDNYYLACEVDNSYKFSMFRISNIENLQDSGKEFYYDIDIQNFISDIQTPFATYKEDYQDYLIKVIVEIDKSKAHFFESKKFLSSQSRGSFR